MAVRTRAAAVLVAGALIAAACGGGGGDATTSTAPPTTTPAPTAAPTTVAPPTTTTTTLPPTTTTTTEPPVEVIVDLDADPRLVEAVGALYRWVADPKAHPAPALPEGLAAHLDGLGPAGSLSLAGEAATAELPSGDSVAVVVLGEDVVLAVDDGAGWRVVGAKLAGLGSEPWYGPSPRLVLIIGSDARPGENQQRLRADSIHILGSVPEDGAASIVGFPRDSWITGPGGGRMKYTSVLAGRGPEVFLDTTLGLTGLPLEGYIVTGFLGFESMVDAVGGLTVDLPQAIRSGFDFVANWPAGEQHLNGDRLLWLTRIRKTLRGGDFARSFNQGMVMGFGLDFVQEEGILALPGLLDVLQQYTWTDLSTEDLLTMAAGAYELERDRVTNMVMPGTVGTTSGGASVVYLTSALPDIMADLSDGVIDEDR